VREYDYFTPHAGRGEKVRLDAEGLPVGHDYGMPDYVGPIIVGVDQAPGDDFTALVEAATVGKPAAPIRVPGVPWTARGASGGSIFAMILPDCLDDLVDMKLGLDPWREMQLVHCPDWKPIP
jgi:hypothetical protein